MAMRNGVTLGGIPHEGILRSIELLGREVAPAVRGELARGVRRPSRIARK
jgi:hypothetical protein